MLKVAVPISLGEFMGKKEVTQTSPAPAGVDAPIPA
jgi:hypothetical protein